MKNRVTLHNAKKVNFDNKELNRYSASLSKVNDGILAKLIYEQMKKEDEIFENAVRENAVPKITGNITKGKLRYRGIRMIINNHNGKTEKWIEQSGKIISPKIVFDTYNVLKYQPT